MQRTTPRPTGREPASPEQIEALWSGDRARIAAAFPGEPDDDPAPEVVDNSPMRTELEAAEHLTCSVGLLRKMRQNGTGPVFYKLGGRLVRYSDQTLAEWVPTQRPKQNGDGEGGQH